MNQKDERRANAFWEAMEEGAQTLGGRTRVATRILDINRVKLYVTDRGISTLTTPLVPAALGMNSDSIEHPIIFDQGLCRCHGPYDFEHTLTIPEMPRIFPQVH